VRDPLQGAWRKDSRSTDADRELQICKELKAKNREMMTFIKHLNHFLTIFDISLFRRSNVRGAGFRPRLVQVCMQICPLGPSARETL
jgi:hypothetical protein